MLDFDRRPGPRVIPRAGDNGPSFQGGVAIPSTGETAWETHPAALALVLLFVLVLAYKVMR